MTHFFLIFHKIAVEGTHINMVQFANQAKMINGVCGGGMLNSTGHALGMLQR